jgi:hypothetical protein
LQPNDLGLSFLKFNYKKHPRFSAWVINETTNNNQYLRLAKAQGARLKGLAPAGFGVGADVALAALGLVLRDDGLTLPLIAHRVELRPRLRVGLENFL